MGHFIARNMFFLFAVVVLTSQVDKEVLEERRYSDFFFIRVIERINIVVI